MSSINNNTSFEPVTVAQIKAMKDLHGKFEGHAIVVYVEGYLGPHAGAVLTGAVVINQGTTFKLCFGSCKMILPVALTWEESFNIFNTSNNVFEVIGYEEASL